MVGKPVVTANVTLRPNITERGDAWDLVPGDIVEKWQSGYLRADWNQATKLQHEEKDYYRPCAYCGRSVVDIRNEGPLDICFRNPCPEAQGQRR